MANVFKWYRIEDGEDAYKSWTGRKNLETFVTNLRENTWKWERYSESEKSFLKTWFKAAEVKKAGMQKT